MKRISMPIAVVCLAVLAACGGEKIDDRAAIVEACNTQQGAGWYRKEYGENYCACYADTAKEKLDADAYKALAAASREALKAGDDKAAREAIARRNTKAYSEASHHAQSCKKA